MVHINAGGKPTHTKFVQPSISFWEYADRGKVMPATIAPASSVSSAAVPLVSTTDPQLAASPVKSVSPGVGNKGADSFTNDGTSSAIPEKRDIAKIADNVIRSFEIELEQKKRDHETANAIVSCLTPLLTPKGPVEDQVWLFFLRIMGKVQSEQRDNDLENSKLERLQKAIKAEREKLGENEKARLDGALAEVEKLGVILKKQHKAGAEEENQAFGSISSLLENQHQAIMTSLREMRAV